MRYRKMSGDASQEGISLGGGGNPFFQVDLTHKTTPDTYFQNKTVTFSGGGSVRMIDDHEGILRRVNSGEVWFRGARRVENLHDNPDVSGW